MSNPITLVELMAMQRPDEVIAALDVITSEAELLVLRDWGTDEYDRSKGLDVLRAHVFDRCAREHWWATPARFQKLYE